MPWARVRERLGFSALDPNLLPLTPTPEQVMPALISKYATRLLNLRVDEIEP